MNNCPKTVVSIAFFAWASWRIHCSGICWSLWQQTTVVCENDRMWTGWYLHM